MNDIKGELSSHLIIRKRDVPQAISNEMYSLLTWENPEYKDALFRGNKRRLDTIPRFIHGFHETDSFYFIAREFYTEFCAVAERHGCTVTLKDKRVYNEPKPIAPRFTPWKSQRSAIRRLLDNQVGHQGILKAPCGAGKTNVLLYICGKLGQNTLILAHTNDLIHQWQERCRNLLGIDPGIIQGNKIDIKQITIASVMTLANRELTPEFLNQWGCVILDEAHHCPADSFRLVMDQFPAYFRFGATATPSRTDDLHGLLFAICGDIIAEITYKELEDEGVIIRPQVKLVETGFDLDYTGNVRDNPRLWHRITESLTTSRHRNDLIAERIVAEANAGNHTQLVLSKQVDHLRYLQRAVARKSPQLQTSLLVASGGKSAQAGMSKSERLRAIVAARKGNIRVLFGTSLADEGLDIPRLDRIHLTFPTRAEGKIEQQIGRIQRTFPGKRDATVIDYVDNVSLLRNQASDRIGVYKQLGLQIQRCKS